MDNYSAVMICEGQEQAISEDEYLQAWQHLIDTGLCWSLQGYFGRTALAMIEAGDCEPPQGYALCDGKLRKVE